MSDVPKILLADDDADFVLLFQTALESLGLRGAVIPVNDGPEAIDYLLGKGRFTDRERYPLPELAIVDLRLRRLSGLEVLRTIRQEEILQQIPVVILTGSETEQEEQNALDEGAAAFLIKPLEFSKLVSLAEHIYQAWVPGALALQSQ